LASKQSLRNCSTNGFKWPQMAGLCRLPTAKVRLSLADPSLPFSSACLLARYTHLQVKNPAAKLDR
jgi:hypothetical protein